MSAAGTCPGVFITESMIDQVARTFNLDLDVVRKEILYKKDQVYKKGGRVRGGGGEGEV